MGRCGSPLRASHALVPLTEGAAWPSFLQGSRKRLCFLMEEGRVSETLPAEWEGLGALLAPATRQ